MSSLSRSGLLTTFWPKCIDVPPFLKDLVARETLVLGFLQLLQMIGERLSGIEGHFANRTLPSATQPDVTCRAKGQLGTAVLGVTVAASLRLELT